MELSNNEVRHQKNLGVEFLEFSAFDAYPELLADFAIRGQANLDYNWSESNGNYIKLAMALGVDYDGIVKAPEQVHGDEAARVKEIARMLGGGDSAAAHAEDMLKQAGKARKKK